MFSLQFPPREPFPNSLQLGVPLLAPNIITLRALTGPGPSRRQHCTCRGDVRGRSHPSPRPTPDEPPTAGSPPSIEGCAAAATRPAPHVRGTSGGSRAEETCNRVLRLIGILFAVSPGHQRTSSLPGCRYVLALFSAAIFSPARRPSSYLSPIRRLSLPFLSLPSLLPSALLHKPLIIA